MTPHELEGEFNGWTNYATCLVAAKTSKHPSFFGAGRIPPENVAEALKEHTQDMVATYSDKLAYDYAMSFLLQVNWREIADRMTENAKQKGAA